MGAFVLQKREVAMENLSCKKIIYCPICGRKVATWDRKSKTDIVVGCKKCNRLVVFHTATEEIEIKFKPKRTQASGMRFY